MYLGDIYYIVHRNVFLLLPCTFVFSLANLIYGNWFLTWNTVISLFWRVQWHCRPQIWQWSYSIEFTPSVAFSLSSFPSAICKASCWSFTWQRNHYIYIFQGQMRYRHFHNTGLQELWEQGMQPEVLTFSSDPKGEGFKVCHHQVLPNQKTFWSW